MTTLQLITNAVTFVYNLPGTDGDATPRRARLLQFAQELVDDFWYYREWPWVYKRTTVAITSGEGNVPSDFQDIGRDGHVFNASTNLPMRHVDPQVIDELAEKSLTYDAADIYTLIGQDTSSPFPTKIKVPMGSGTLTLRYRKVAPTLQDVSTAATNGLTQIPVAYHNMVFTPGMYWKGFASIDDPRAQLYKAEYVEGRARAAVADLAGKDTVRRLPMTIPRMC